jgi:hypothetical protein
VTRDIGSGHVFVANQSECATSDVTQVETTEGFSCAWRPEQNQAIDTGGESVIDVFPARGEVGFDEWYCFDGSGCCDFAGAFRLQYFLLMFGWLLTKRTGRRNVCCHLVGGATAHEPSRSEIVFVVFFFWLN